MSAGTAGWPLYGSPLLERESLHPRVLVPPDLWDAAVAEGLAVEDTGETVEPTGTGRYGAETGHPTALAERAVHVVEAHRGRLERQLAEEWCRVAAEALYIDGSVTGSERVATSSHAVGVVKRHRTLYVGAEGCR